MSRDLRVCPTLQPYGRRRAVKVVVAVAAIVVLAGCSTIRRGGAPEPSFDVNRDLEQLAQQFAPSDSITKFYEKPDKDARDKFITGRLTMMNIRYIQFIKQLTSERQLLDSATDMLALGLNLAGTSVAGAGAKTLLAAIAAGVTGSRQVIDKNYFFEKTLPALVAQMNADRKKALVPILTGMRKELGDYPFAEAVTDLHNYYHAGTFIGAIQAIQADAGAKEREKDEIIATLSPLSMQDVVDKKKLSESVGALADVAKGKLALTALKVETRDLDTLDKVKQALQARVRNAREAADIAKVTKAFREAGILVE